MMAPMMTTRMTTTTLPQCNKRSSKVRSKKPVSGFFFFVSITNADEPCDSYIASLCEYACILIATGGHMNQRSHKPYIALAMSALVCFLVNCQGSETVETADHFQNIEQNDDLKFEKSAQAIVVEVPINESHVKAQKDVVASADIAPGDPVLSTDTALLPANPIMPWQAATAYAHGLLPTRFQDKGPFLYSTDVSPEAAASEDNIPLGPYEFFQNTDDDDGVDDDE